MTHTTKIHWHDGVREREGSFVADRDMTVQIAQCFLGIHGFEQGVAVECNGITWDGTAYDQGDMIRFIDEQFKESN